MIYKNEILSKYNWFNLGGPAKILFKPNSIHDLENFLKKNNKENKIYVLGAGSNILFRDSGFDGAIIKLGSGFNYTKLLDDGKIEVGAATLDKKIAEFAIENSISGLEFLSCIPGSIGGGILMNSGCYGHDISKVFFSLKAMDLNGELKTFSKDEIKFSYRRSDFGDNLIILNVVLQGKNGNKDDIKKNQEQLITKKKQSQPSRIKTCGSTFKNPRDKKAWELIKSANCSHFTIGGASISQKHNNFFINNGNATSLDIENLINKVKEEVFLKTGTKLELEIKIIGGK
ncbi:MAG: UDP-N-acetylenolpyruvoylglucosamine reductase [Candidatus Pelagibacter sp.]|nr:UDP-N-acetylenolpyruvoylglucosamine reductase [Candidatus Pelagibacter sp.]|tara:strand:- start:13837 stop:14697 length:861 start_codon:yes stop_codon:yes gene_type:complete